MQFKYKDEIYEVEVIKKNNKNTYIRVWDGKITVTTGYLINKWQIANLLDENRKSIEKMIEKDKKRMEKRELFVLFGEYYEIVYGEFDKPITMEEGKIAAVNREVLCNWLDDYVNFTFYRHLMYWHDEFKGRVPIPNLKIKKMKTRWGVCNTKNKNVTLNLELFRYDIKCLDYVIIHELAHFIEPNHSKKFWKIVEEFCPNYKEIRKILKD